MKLIKAQTAAGSVIYINPKAITSVFEKDIAFVCLSDGSHANFSIEEWQKILKEITGGE